MAKPPSEAESYAHILTPSQPLGPGADRFTGLTEEGSQQLFDRNNLIYSQAFTTHRPAYVIGRKGAGKTAFLRGSSLDGEIPQRVLKTPTVYSEMVATLAQYRIRHTAVFAEQIAELWRAVFDHVVLSFVCETGSNGQDNDQFQVAWDYLSETADWLEGATAVAERFLVTIRQRISDYPDLGLYDVINDLSRRGITFGAAKVALADVLAMRRHPVMIVMDNLEDLHSQIDGIKDVLQGLFHAIGIISSAGLENERFGVQVCMPSEMWDEIHRISTNPEKDFDGNFLTIHWTAKELLHLVESRFRLFLRAHHPEELDRLTWNVSASDNRSAPLLRAALPSEMTSGLNVVEDPIAYLLRHTQLLPRHLIEILNGVLTAGIAGSMPWKVSQEAILLGTRKSESLIIEGIFTAYQGSYPLARTALKRLSNRLSISFPAKDLRKAFNREGIRKLTDMDFDEFSSMLFALGIVGVKVDSTSRYNTAQFQYTYESSLNAQEDADELCFHPLFTRFLFERTLPRLRQRHELPTYPYGTDPNEDDYRARLGYSAHTRSSR